MRLLGSQSNRWRSSKALPYVLAALAGAVGGATKATLKETDLYPQPPSFWAQLGVEFLFWFFMLAAYFLLVLLVYWPDVKQEIDKRRR
jgi:hypothetical protein